MSTEPHDPSNPLPYDPNSWTWPEDMRHVSQDDAHKATCDWLVALGLELRRVPADPHASIADGQLTLRMKVRGPAGGDLLTPDRTGVMTETVTVPVTVPPPPIVQIWLAPKCPTCGR